MASQRRQKYNLNISLERELYVNLPGVPSSSDTGTDEERQFKLHCSETSDSVGDDGSGVGTEERIDEEEEDAGIGIFLSPHTSSTSRKSLNIISPSPPPQSDPTEPQLGPSSAPKRPHDPRLPPQVCRVSPHAPPPPGAQFQCLPWAVFSLHTPLH
ncbi:hypothetical protein GWK47_054372 [Chionoecetes opilio]|uniref:Uncharacterized protein n=1 Tax=Chionoecetes opilio TaxID=41210 RepID=A0A8J4Y721_CHIOP|nr:hypothetical protein GWK47_054372 [Chionoecetes opilio]